MTTNAVVFLYIILCVGTIMGLMTILENNKSKGGLIVGTWSFLGLVCLLGVNFHSSKYEREFYIETFQVNTIDNIDYISYNGELINLNKKFERDFDGSVDLKVYPARYYGWIYYGEKIEPTWKQRKNTANARASNEG